MRALVDIANKAKTDAQRNAVGATLLKMMNHIACTPDRLLFKRGRKI
jgi:hypothetical protein